MTEAVDIGFVSLSQALESGLVSFTVEVDTRSGELSLDNVLEIKREIGEKGYDTYHREDPTTSGIYHIRVERRKNA